MTDIETIAMAISPERRGWCWEGRWLRKGGQQTARFVQLPDIGPHNILKVIAWAAKQTWWNLCTNAKIVSNSPQTYAKLEMDILFRDGVDVWQTTEAIIKIIADAIRK